MTRRSETLSAREFANQSNRPYDQIAAGYARGMVHLTGGDFDKAEEILSDVARLSRENEVRLFLPLALCMLGSAHVQSGRATRAERILLEAKQAAQSVGYQTVMVLASVYLASVHAQLGDPVR